MLGEQRIPNDLLAVFVLTFLLITFIMIPPLSDSFIRLFLGMIFVLFLPGYALISALFPRKGDLEPLFRFALSFFMSIAIVPLLGIALNYTRWGIKINPVLITLSIFTLFCVGIAYHKRLKLPPEEQIDFSFSQFIEFIELKKLYHSYKPYLFLLLVSIVASMGIIYYGATHPHPPEQFTEFYVLSEGNVIGSYAKDLKPNQSAIANVVVVNHEHSITSYILYVNLQKSNVSNNVVKTSFVLNHNETWEKKIPYKASEVGKYELQFLLYKENVTEKPYRELHLWLDVRG